MNLEREFLWETPKTFCGNLMAGVYNKRLAKPGCCFVWDIETILRYFRTLLIKKLLSTKKLALKLTLLLVLTSASICFEITHLDIRLYTKSQKFCFNVIQPTKTRKTSKH